MLSFPKLWKRNNITAGSYRAYDVSDLFRPSAYNRLSKVDDFMRNLYQIYLHTKDDIVQVYLLHAHRREFLFFC